MRPTHLRSSKLHPHNSYYTGTTLQHPTLGPLPILEDTKKNLVLGYRVNIDKFGLRESGLLKINERLSHENLLRLDGINSINLNSEHFIFIEIFEKTLDEEILYRAQRNSIYEEADIFRILYDIGSALAYLQANQISHVQVKGDAIVKVGSKYKLLDLSPFVKSKSRNSKPLAICALGNRTNGGVSSSAQENHKDNVTRLAFLVLDAMNLRPDSGKPTESKLGTAAELYSGPLIRLLRKMLELNSSLRLDCATCLLYIKELYKQPISANSLVNNSFFKQHVQKENSIDVLKNSLANTSQRSIKQFGSPSVNNRYAPEKSVDDEKYVESANIKEFQDYLPTRDTRENMSLSSGSFDENPIASEPMELDQASPHINYDDERQPTSIGELKNEPVSSSKQEFDKLRSPGSACNPFKDMNDLMRHNSPPNTTIKDYSTDYMTTSDSPLKTRSERIETSPPKKVESIKEVDEQRPEETLIFSEAYDHFHTEPKALPLPEFSMKKPKKLPTPLDFRLPTFGDDDGDDSELESAKFASSRGHKPQNNEDMMIMTHKPRQPSIIKETPLDVSIKSGERSPLKQPETVTEVYPDGSVYKGEVFGRMKHGIGRLTYADGSCYEGEWNQDNIEGYGVLFYSNGKIGYEGEWQNNKCNGRGVMYNEQVQLFNEFEQEKSSREKGTWHRYEGGFCNDKWEGEGRLVFTNGDEFCGDFVNDLIHGTGRYTSLTGESFEGEWVNNVLVQVFED